MGKQFRFIGKNKTRKNNTSSFFLFPSSLQQFENGFTVLELLVASLLLSMLVTVVTMIFNQSSIAWRTGVAGVVELSETRAVLGTYHDIEDDALPGLGEQSAQPLGSRPIKYRTVSIFRNWNGNGAPTPSDVSTAGRLYAEIPSTMQTITDAAAQRGDGSSMTLKNGTSKGGDAYLVGVRSSGPDKQMGTSDDISTLPEEESK